MISLLFLALTAQAETFQLATWNIHDGEKFAQVLTALKAKPLVSSDFFHLQEAPPEGESDLLPTLDSELGTSHESVGYDSILHRHEVIARGSLLINPATGRQALWVDARLPGGTVVRLYSFHLSYKVKKSPFIAQIRANEIQVVLDHAKGFSGPIVAAGDFNTVGWLLGGHKKEKAIQLMLAAGFIDALAKAGGRTHKLVGRIDWIFSKGLKPVSAERGGYDGSDHRWLTATFSTD